MQRKILFILSMLGVQYLYTDIKKIGDGTYFNSKKNSSKSATFANIENHVLTEKMVIKHKMLYILPEIECKYSLKHSLQGEMSHF